MFWKTIQQLILAFLDAKKSANEESNAERRASRWAAGATVAMAFFAFFTIGVGIVTVLVLRDQLKESRAEQRPVLWTGNNLGQPQYYVPPGAKTGQIIWSFHPYNYGRGMVISGHARSYIQFGTEAPKQSYKQPEIGQVISPIAPSQDTVSTVVSDPGLSAEQFAILIQRNQGITVIVVANYTDLAGNAYETGMCFSRLNTGAISYCTTKNYIK